MALTNENLNNISNFLISYIVRNSFKDEKVFNELVKFIFGISKEELLKEINETLIAYDDSNINTSLNGDYKYLYSKLDEFINLNNIETQYKLEIQIIIDDEMTNISKIQRKYNVGFARASRIFELKNSLI